MEELVGAADGEVDTCTVQVDLDGAGCVGQVPHDEGTCSCAASGLCCEIEHLGRSVVDQRPHGYCDAGEVVEARPHLQVSISGDALDDVAVGWEVGWIDGDSPPTGRSARAARTSW